MKQFNAYDIYQLASYLHPMSEWKPPMKRSQVYFNIYMAKSWMNSIWQGRPLPLVVCKTAASELWSVLNEVVPNEPATENTDMEEVVAPWLIYQIQNKTKEFETILAAEVRTLDTYFVSQTLAYNTADLILRAENILPEAVRSVISDPAIQDIRQAGRCIAFDLPTGCGFHIMRATESVIRQYYDVVVGSKPKNRNWGTYIDHLRKHDADAKVINAIDQLREMHRNPIMHPEVVLTTDEATMLIGLAQSAITGMANDIQKRLSSIPGVTPDIVP